MGYGLRHGILDYKIEIGGAPAPSYPTDGLMHRWTFDSSLTSEPGTGYTPITFSKIGTVDYSTNNKIGGQTAWLHAGSLRTTDGSVAMQFRYRNPSTVVTWINNPDTIYPFCAGRATNGSPYEWTFLAQASTTRLDVLRRNTLADTDVHLDSSFGYNNWKMFYYQYDGSIAKWGVYPDVSASITSTTNITSTNYTRFVLGVRADLDRTVTALYDNVYLYNRSLTENELQQLWNNGSGV